MADIKEVILNVVKNLITLLIIGLVFLSSQTFAQQSGFGLGVIVGEPTGVCGKYWLDDANAIDGGVAWAFKDEGAVHVHGDYLFHKYDVFSVDKGKLPLYYGIGGRIKFDEDDSKFGVRIPVGMNYIFANDPLDFFIEIVPILNLAPKTDLGFNAAIGIRFFF